MNKINNKSRSEKGFKRCFNADSRRAFISPFFYIMLGVAFIVPILILVMTTMAEGTAPNTPNAGQAALSFENVWQIIGSTANSSDGTGGGMDIIATCNVNLIYFAAAVFVCLFIGEEFKSGYVKNLFAIRAGKVSYVASKNLVGFICSSCMVIAFFVGAIIGGGVAGLSFETEGFNFYNLACCLLSKIALLPTFVSIFVLASVIAKQRTWLSLCLSLGVGALLFTAIPALTPLDATLFNVSVCLLVGVVVSVGLGAASNAVLKKVDLV